MTRAFLFVLDSFGIGNAPDAAAFGDVGSNTFGHIDEACAAGRADKPGIRQGPLNIPNMERLGRRHAYSLVHGQPLPAFKSEGFFAGAAEISKGKDTPSGHWEIAGLPVPFEWTFFPKEQPTFPDDLLGKIYKQADLSGSLGNCHASGTDIIDRFGEEHLKTGKPIFYTSSDSVFQIAAHETHFGLERLYQLCEMVFALTAPMRVGRVIARPFLGDNRSDFKRTANRHDYAIPPPSQTLLDRLVAAGKEVHAVGKIGDVFAQHGISTLVKASGNMALFDASLAAMDKAKDGDLVFANFVDFDMEYGHRRDVPGYAAALEAFDKRLPAALAKLKVGDLLILTADHGCDPTWHGTDHTREQIPVFGTGPHIVAANLGLRTSFSDIGETVGRHLGLEKGPHGISFLPQLLNA
ncbi:MAG: phosphopentomutase [Notoacmeibacter sp.]